MKDAHIEESAVINPKNIYHESTKVRKHELERYICQKRELWPE